MSSTSTRVEALVENISRALFGKREVIQFALTALLAKGHLLIEDAPGVGKTSLAKAIAQSLNCEFKRLQFTPDLLPSDILGTTVFLPNKGEFEFRPGPIFSNVLLADEINRTTPRTQSALLEAMSERQVSIDGVTHQLDAPFFVIATQNPFEFEGTYSLPENQLDRFMIRTEVGYPPKEYERDVLIHHQKGDPVTQIQAVLSKDDVMTMQSEVQQVQVDESIHDYILAIVHATREHEQLTLGVSTRGAITMARAVQSYAYVMGRDYAIPEDVKTLAVPVFAHRVLTGGFLREGQRQQTQLIVEQILNQISVPV